MTVPEIGFNFWEGTGVGLVFGIVIGATWENAYEMIESAIVDYRERRGRMTQEELYISEGARKWVWRLGVLLAITAVVLMAIGGFQVYQNSRLTNFIQCQATYNQQAYEARQARVIASNRENATFYAWLETVPALVSPRDGQQADPKAVRNFRHKLLTAVETHRENVQSQKHNPYPPDPRDTCGEY